MRTVIETSKVRKNINLYDNIIYSKQNDLTGQELELKMSIMLQNGNSEKDLTIGCDDEDDKVPKPALLFIPGGAYRGRDKNQVVPEMQFLAEAGFVVASMYYRSSAQGHFPAQIQDVKTAIRFLRAHCTKYEIDPDRIGLIGLSAGGHLASLANMNEPGFDTDEWGAYSSDVCCCCDLFGPVDIVKMLHEEQQRLLEQAQGSPDQTIEESAPGALMGGSFGEDMLARAEQASSPHWIGEHMAPILILHGDADKLVPVEVSENFYQRIVEAGYEERAELYILRSAGHNTREFYQPEIKELILRFFKKNL